MERFNPGDTQYTQKVDLPPSEQKNFRDDTESGVGFVKKEAWDLWRRMKYYQRLIDVSSSAGDENVELPTTAVELMEDWAREDELRLAHIELTDEDRAVLVASIREKRFVYEVTERYAGFGQTAYLEGAVLNHDGSNQHTTGDSIVREGAHWRAGLREQFTEIDSIERLVNKRSLRYDLNDVALATIEKNFGIENIEKMECYFLDNILDSVVVYPKGQEEGALVYSQNGSKKTRFVSFCESMYGEEDSE